MEASDWSTDFDPSFPFDQSFRDSDGFGAPISICSHLTNEASETLIDLIYEDVIRSRNPYFDSEPAVTAFDGDSQSSTKTSSDFPLKFYSSVSSSIRERTKDIMSVVGALLFGVGCGALTAAVTYFMWALFSPNRYDFFDVSSSSDDNDQSSF